MYNKTEKGYIVLELYDGLTYYKKREIINIFNDIGNIFDDYKYKIKELTEIVGQDKINDFLQTIDENQVNNFLRNLQEQNIIVLTCESENYPQKLLNYPDYPYVLYAKGDIQILKANLFGIVGTRKITRYGKDVTKQFATVLSQNNFVIVSGMADGVDTVAHTSALECGGKTIAVLGSGFNNIYPTTNYNLSKQIEKNGLLLSEYKPSVKPSTYTFPIRNRIIAGLSCGVLVTEAGEKSGAMYTKDYCLDYNVNLYAVPANIDNITSKGCNLIIKSCQASMVTCPQDILDDLGVNNIYVSPKKNSYQLSLEEQLIVNTIKYEEMHIDEIAILTKLDTKALLSYLTIMEINGIIKKLQGNYYKNVNYHE